MLVVLDNISEIKEIKNEDLLNSQFLSRDESEKEQAWSLFLEENIKMFFWIKGLHLRRTLHWHKASSIELISSLDESEKEVFRASFISIKKLRESFERLYFPDDD